MKKTLLALILLSSFQIFAQVLITDPAEIYTQNFNLLSPVTLENSHETLPLGWECTEYGTNANDEYRAAEGEFAGGDLYSFGDALGADSTERALGSIGTGSLHNIHYGASFVNTSDETINAVTLSYSGELWRVGNAERATGPDTLHFFYSVNADSIDNPEFTALTDLNFISPATPGDPRNQIMVDGNAEENTVIIEYTFDVTIAPNDTLWLKWFDVNSSSFDDALGIDDLSMTFHPEPAEVSHFGVFSMMDVYNYEDFNLLGNEYNEFYGFSSLPIAWFAKEYGVNANETYHALPGDNANGNIYSFGETLSDERALGSIGSGGLSTAIYGSAWINNTAETVENVEVNFTGEMWRQGRPLRATGPDTLFFSYAKNAENIGEGDYNGFGLLDFYSPVEEGTLGIPTDGNDEMYRTEKSAVIGALNLAPGDTLWIRWTDHNSNSYDDGLAIDDFTIAPLSTADVLTVSFQDENSYFNEDDGVVALPIVLENGNEFLTQVEVQIESLGTVELGVDVNVVPAVVSFAEGLEEETSYFYFEILNSEPLEGDEYFVLKLTNPANAFLGEIVYDTIRIANYVYPTTPIEDLRGVNADGIANEIGTNVLIEGVVHGVNFNYTGGVDFYVVDGEFGMDVYNAEGSMGYDVQEGDAVKVWGKIGQFRGLTRLENLDAIEFVSADNDLATAIDLNTIEEENEAAYIVLDSLKLYPAITYWPSNIAVQAVNIATEDTIAIYISSNGTLAGELAPTGPFRLYGLGSQKSEFTYAPFNDGYRIMGLSTENQSFASINVDEENRLNVFPNPVSNQLTVTGAIEGGSLKLMSITGQTISTVNNLTNIMVKLNVADLTPGIYFVSITKAGTVQTVKIIKK